jgi:alkane 1-monooxygenase
MSFVARKLGFYTAFIIPTLVITGFYFGGYWNVLAIGFSFVLIPAIDQLLGVDTSNVPVEEVNVKAEDFFNCNDVPTTTLMLISDTRF